MTENLEINSVDPRIELCQSVLPEWARLLEISRSQSDLVIDDMMTTFTELTPYLPTAAIDDGSSLSNIEHSNASEIAALIEKFKVGFQSQDRISQILSLVISDVKKMIGVIQEKSPAPGDVEISHWLSTLASQYVVPELKPGYQPGANAGVLQSPAETLFFNEF